MDRRLKLANSPTMYRWLLGGRVLLAGAALVQAFLSRDESPGFAVAGLVIVALALIVTLYSGYVSLAQAQRPTLWSLRLQALMDLLLVTTVVHFAGSQQTGWVALYVLVIAIYGLTMPLGSGLSVALAGAAMYLADAYLGLRVESVAGVWGQVAVFTIVSLVVAGLGQRLRTAAAEQTQLATELERVRLEADEILRNIRSGVLNVDSRGYLAFINPTAEQLLELDARRYLGRPVLELLAQRAPELQAAIQAGLERGHRLARGEGLVHKGGGRSFPIGLSTATFRREGDQRPSVTAIFTDISDLQYLEDLRLRTERLEAVAALGASMAHEIRNPLASIRSAVEQLASSRRDDPDERILADLILRESDRLSRLLGEFLDFSRVQADRFGPVNLVAVAQDAARMVKEHPDCHPEVEIAVSGAPFPIQGDEDLVHRIVWNLLLNAVQALTDGGRIDVQIDQPDASELPVGADFEQPARLRVVDDGPGIDPEVQDKLFQPFVSGRVGGSGLGLAIVQRAVAAHRGLVLVDSAPGAGTTFTILLHTKWPTEETA